MISKLSIKNFKCLRDVTVNLERFTVFVGVNGSGKTSFLQAIDLLCRTFLGDPIELNREYQQNGSYGATSQVELECHSGHKFVRYRSNVNLFGDPTGSGNYNRRIFGGLEESWAREVAKYGSEGNPGDWKLWKISDGALPNPVWLRLDPNALRYSQVWDPRNLPMMQSNGQGLHIATAAMSLEDPDRWLMVQDQLRRIVPTIRRLRHTPLPELLFDTINGKGFKAQQVSEGTLLTLGLLTAIHGANKPGILLLDDLDRALHPKAQRELIDLLRGIQETNSEIQIVASTHSPYMLDRMKPNEIQVTTLREDGSTACQPIMNHPDFEKWKDEFQPGELWSFFGESWVVGENPKAENVASVEGDNENGAGAEQP